MSLQFGCARAISALSTWGLKHVFHRPAANFPGKAALYADPNLISHLRNRLATGSLCVVGTNGKTTVTNMLADAFEAAGQTVCCNRTGANLDSGVATALLHTPQADWGVFECDELWLAKILPHTKSDYVLLLNLFRDQLDRVGEIDHIQESIVAALDASPDTVLVYNADDPLCQAIANRMQGRSLAFGIGENLNLLQNTVTDASMCQECSEILNYEYRQYGQLGKYQCPQCGFTRSTLDFEAVDVQISDKGLCFLLRHGMTKTAIKARFSGTYMVYNLLALFAVSALVGIPLETVQSAVNDFNPNNGRLQRYVIGNTPVLLNLAKNPTGFNQNLNIVLQGSEPKAVGFFINDKEADGHDVSWLWDIDFQKLANISNLIVFAGGIRRNDMQVRLKYAGISAQIVDGARDMMERAASMLPAAHVYIIANYTALPAVKAELDALQSDSSGNVVVTKSDMPSASDIPPEGDMPSASDMSPETDIPPITIVHMLPELLNLYGDGGNVTVLEHRLRARGIPVQVQLVHHGESPDFTHADIVFMGGGPDREQRLASQDLAMLKRELQAYVEDDGVVLAICGGYQILGNAWLLGEESVPGLRLIDMETKRAPGGSHNRLVNNIVLRSDLATNPVVGYENHAGRTHLASSLKSFGAVVGSHGVGNNETDKADGVLYRNVVGTYLHGPLLAKNPEVADALLQKVLDRRREKGIAAPCQLNSLNDAEELAANRVMRERLGIK